MVSGRTARPSRSLQQQAIALLVVSLFTFQLSRNFLIIELDQFICLEPTHTHGVGPASSMHHHDAAEATPHSHDDGNAIQHCKDSFGDIALTPVQPLGSPVMASYQPPPASRTVLASQRYQAVENDLAPPFQPPRFLS